MREDVPIEHLLRVRHKQGVLAAAELVESRYRGFVAQTARKAASHYPWMEAEDLEQDIWLAIFRGLPGYKGRAPVSGWISRVARNVIATSIQRHSGRKPIPLETLDPEDPEPRADARIIRAEEHALLAQEIAVLPEGDQELLGLRYGSQHTVRQIAQAIGQATEATKSRIRRIQDKLKKAVTRRYRGDEETDDGI